MDWHFYLAVGAALGLTAQVVLPLAGIGDPPETPTAWLVGFLAVVALWPIAVLMLALIVIVRGWQTAELAIGLMSRRRTARRLRRKAAE